jgi:DNA polymerase IV
MPAFKRTRSKVDETDSESGGSPTIGKRSNKSNKTLGDTPATHRKLHNLPRKFAVYIVGVKLGADHTMAGLSELVRGSADYTLAKDAEEADVVITGIGMRKRLERSIPTNLIVSCRRSSHLPGAQCQQLSQDQMPIVKPEWLEKSIKGGKRQPYDKYQALYIKQGEAADNGASSGGHGNTAVDGEGVTTSAQADLSPAAKLACQRESPLVCPNQELVEQIDVLKRARELDVDRRGTLSYARAIAVGSLKTSLYALR